VEEDLLACDPSEKASKKLHFTDSKIHSIAQPRKPRIGPEYQAVIPDLQQPAPAFRAHPCPTPARANPAAASLAALGLLTTTTQKEDKQKAASELPLHQQEQAQQQ